VLPSCKNKSTSGSGSSHTATCSWRPSNRGSATLTASAVPTGAGISSSTSAPISIRVGNRTGAR
jgi:galactokinase